jgi:hypothetical protein
VGGIVGKTGVTQTYVTSKTYRLVRLDALGLVNWYCVSKEEIASFEKVSVYGFDGLVLKVQKVSY